MTTSSQTTSWSAMLIRAFVVTMSATMLITLLVPGRADASASQPYGATTPCPNFAIQDVFDDPKSDWDNDRVTNVVELYNGLNPCIYDTTAFCLTSSYYCSKVVYNCSASYHWKWTLASVESDPHGDWDGDGVSNRTEVKYGANPCSHPCPNPHNIDLQLNPNGAWDNDGVTNSIEVYQGTNPCNSYSYNPCPNWRHYQVDFMPYMDWDGDGILNLDEIRSGYSPCYSNTVQRLPHVDVPLRRLPHLAPPPPPPPAPAPGYTCPPGYPYYHAGLCYANPIGNFGY